MDATAEAGAPERRGSGLFSLKYCRELVGRQLGPRVAFGRNESDPARPFRTTGDLAVGAKGVRATMLPCH